MALLVYSLIERRAREALKEADERFENMRVVRINGQRELPSNVEVPERVLGFLDLDVTVYGVESVAQARPERQTSLARAFVPYDILIRL